MSILWDIILRVCRECTVNPYLKTFTVVTALYIDTYIHTYVGSRYEHTYSSCTICNNCYVRTYVRMFIDGSIQTV